jgi:hypothetical protein
MGGPYQIDSSVVVARALDKLQKRASQEGRGEEVLAAIRQMRQRLQQDPANFGEPLYRLPALKMQIRSAVVRPLVVHFGVCEDRPLVIIKGVELLPEEPA